LEQEAPMPEQRARRFVTRGDTRIEVSDEGRGRLLVMLPSSSRDSEDFDPVAAAFARAGLRVLRPQPRGMCGSMGPLTGLTLHDLAADVASAIEDTGNGAAVVLGHAFGQWVARTLACDRPELVRGLVLAAAAARSPAPELRDALQTCSDPAQPDAERLTALRRAFFAPGHDPSVWLTGWHKQAGQTQREAVAATPRHEWWAGGTAPILDLQAAQDPWRPRETADELRRELGPQRVTVAVIENASHALLPEQPDAFVAAVLDWIRRLPH
jgi:pimeloyl-ACP methyl ester carboxylesterase